MSKSISVIGLGYVGLPLAVALGEAGFVVNGIDTNLSKIATLKSGSSTIEDISSSKVFELIEGQNLNVSSDFSTIKDSEIVIICVPTPLNADSQPDYTYIFDVLESIKNHLSISTLVILESTVSPGFTRDIFIPKLRGENNSSDKDLHFAYSPERIDPANGKWGIKNTPKLVAGEDEVSLKMAAGLYSQIVDHVEECKSLEIAETAKLLENSFRLINISFINEISIFCNKIGIDVREVITAASTKPYGFMTFYPSIGAGGHCIPVDPVYLSSKAAELGIKTKMIEVAAKINHEMPEYFIQRAKVLLGDLNAKNIIVIGLAYKPNVNDMRESHGESLVLGLRNNGAQVHWHDDLVKEWNSEQSVALSSQYDLAILATPHDYLDLTKLGDVPILNTRGSI